MQKLIEWTDEFSICEPIDSQHKKIIDLINKLYDAFVNAKAKEVVSEIISELIAYADYHFRTEEQMFEKYNYSLKHEHIREHDYLRTKVNEFVRRYDQGDDFLMYDLMNFMRDWLRDHILLTDKKYVDEICNR